MDRISFCFYVCFCFLWLAADYRVEAAAVSRRLKSKQDRERRDERKGAFILHTPILV